MNFTKLNDHLSVNDEAYLRREGGQTCSRIPITEKLITIGEFEASTQFKILLDFLFF